VKAGGQEQYQQVLANNALQVAIHANSDGIAGYELGIRRPRTAEGTGPKPGGGFGSSCVASRAPGLAREFVKMTSNLRKVASGV